MERDHNARSSSSLAVTRVINACVLLELGDDAVLTDPYFTSHWFMRFREPIGLGVSQLPRLSAILGGHSVFDHWRPSSLGGYPYKQTTPVFVATKSMAASARSAGFEKVEILEWGERRRISGALELEVAPAQTVAGLKVNNYVLSTRDMRVFFGSEARDLDRARALRSRGPLLERWTTSRNLRIGSAHRRQRWLWCVRDQPRVRSRRSAA
jgi:L-ascorbate metabolism protein UlaG (beta-lactamase superfamily)